MGSLAVTGFAPPATLSVAQPPSTLFCVKLVLPMGGRLTLEREPTCGRELMYALASSPLMTGAEAVELRMKDITLTLWRL